MNSVRAARDCDVEPIVQQSCQGCHASGGIAPFPLDTYEQVKLHAAEISAAVSSRIMPPWMPSDGCGQPFVSALRMLAAWRGCVMPKASADSCCRLSELGTRVLSRVDLRQCLEIPVRPIQIRRHLHDIIRRVAAQFRPRLARYGPRPCG